ncbi:copper chaperone PCu(A)C [Pseudomonas cavernae]|uniref:Copper chaperone PCu(A)C n=1 Tax=Pseudomonas cavernae TaxID=2320867 RepID=A0A385YY55_9PSED|nr:copper chaperone PCu(A)C [Pseudomonas cavernae]AYC31494.1 copper chaperone PCu(A)C [Pseudomonas cavernae]
MKLTNALLLTALLLPAAFAGAHDYAAGTLHIEHPWSREMPPSAPTAAAYFVVHNKGAAADRLLGVDTPMAAKAELHEHVQAGELMKMQQVQSVEVPAGGEASFAPGAYHVMLFGLQQQYRDGQRFPLTLHFEKAGDVKVEVAVQKQAPAEQADHADHAQHAEHDHAQ